MKIDPSIIYMFPDNKQKLLQMRYHEEQVDYYGLKVMSLLEFMEIR